MHAVTPPDVHASRTWHLTPDVRPDLAERRPLVSTCDECGRDLVGPVATVLHYVGGCTA